MKKSSSIIIAHRGESFDAPENTMAAINLAWERGAKTVEIDVHLSQDNEVVVIHDYNTKRLAGVNKKVKHQSLDELKKLDIGSWKDIQWKGEQIPSISEVLNSMPEEKKLIIEIKTEAEIIPFLQKEMEKSELKTEQIELIGFDLKTMALTKKAFPDHKVLWLLDLDYYWYAKVLKPSIKKSIRKAKKHGLNGLNVWAGNLLEKKMIQQVHEAELLLYCWTVNDIPKAKNLMDWGIDGITTDGAQWLSSHLMENR